MNIALIRHGLTAWNQKGQVQGSVETDLCEEGRIQMGALMPPDGFRPAEDPSVRAFVSPQKRARQTAALLGIENPTPDARIREQNWGDWEGMSRDEMRARFGADCFARNGVGLAFRPPHGEASFELLARVKDFLIDVGRTDTPAVAVAHMGVLRAAYAAATGWNMDGVPEELNLRAALILKVEGEAISVAALNVELPKKQTDR